MLKRVLGCSLALLLTSAAQAESGVEITPFVTQRAGGGMRDASGNDVNLQGKGGIAIALDWAASEHDKQYELLYSRQNTTIDTALPTRMRVEYLQIGGTTLIGDETSHVVPFASGGVGAARFSPSDTSLTPETRWAFNLGAGVRIPIVKHVRLRLEARGYLTWLNGNSSLFCNSSTACSIQPRGQTIFQYEAMGGVSFGF